MAEKTEDDVLPAEKRCKDLLTCNIVDLDNMSTGCIADLLILARERQRLVDRTPLTPDLLVEYGGERAGIPVGEFIRFRGWKVYVEGEGPKDWAWLIGFSRVHWRMVPRTLGELEMFCELIKGRE